MYWIQDVYKKLDKKYKEQLSTYKLSTEEIIKDVFSQLRQELLSPTLPTVWLEGLGTFSAPPSLLYKDILKVVNSTNYDLKVGRTIPPEKQQKLTDLVNAYNHKVSNKLYRETKKTTKYQLLSIVILDDKQLTVQLQDGTYAVYRLDKSNSKFKFKGSNK